MFAFTNFHQSAWICRISYSESFCFIWNLNFAIRFTNLFTCVFHEFQTYCSTYCMQCPAATQYLIEKIIGFKYLHAYNITYFLLIESFQVYATPNNKDFGSIPQFRCLHGFLVRFLDRQFDIICFQKKKEKETACYRGINILSYLLI